ncbi:hypothetical protein ZWY2020_049091 [Hordeum vulgare]|nr:hypothetical protein ZWY2020_049091 [Hordeum vulgare]
MLLCAILALEDGRDALAVLARRTASAIQKTSIDRVNIGPGSDVHTIDDDVEPNTPIYVHVETQLPDLNAVDSSVSGIVEPSGAAQTGGLGDTSASVEAATPLATLFPLSASVDDSDTTSSVETSSVVGDSSSDSDEQTDDFLGDAPVVLARVVPPHLAPFVIDNGPLDCPNSSLEFHMPQHQFIGYLSLKMQCNVERRALHRKRMVDSFREDGEMTYYTVDAGVRMFNEKEMVMMQGIDTACGVAWFLLTLRFSSSRRLEIMIWKLLRKCSCLVGWGSHRQRAACLVLYAFDMHAKILNILDPVHTLQYQEVMAGLHAADADLFLAELGEVGLALVEGFTINRDEWDIEYNIGINNPCSVNESIVYLFHYARNFTRANLAEQIDEDGLVVLQKKLFYDIMVMDDNAGETRGLMER